MSQQSTLTIPDDEFSNIIRSKATDYAKEWQHGDLGDAFAQWVTEILLDIPEDDAFNASYVGKVGHEHGLDSISQYEKTLYLIQAKGTEDFKPKTFDESVIDDFLRCLVWLENPTLNAETSSYEFQRASQRYKQAIETGCDVRLILAVLGDLSPDAKARFGEEKAKLARRLPNHSLEYRTFKDLKEQYIESLVLEKDFEDTISLQVQPNELFEKDVGSLKSIVVTIPAKELRRIYLAYGSRLFFYNVRFYLEKTPVNKAILNTLKDADHYKSKFWHLNNGIVIVCDQLGWQDKSHTELKLSAPQIVNGCQTVASLAEAKSGEHELDGVDVLARIIQTTDREFALKITQATNTQNANSSRDLASNQPEQIRLQGLFAAITPPFYYQRKRKEFDNLEPSTRAQYTDQLSKKPRLLDNRDVANAYLSFACQMPTDARTKAKELFDVNTNPEGKDRFYDLIFKGQRTAEEYLLPTLLAQKIDSYLLDFRKRRNVFEQYIRKKLRTGEKLSPEDERHVQEYRSMEALPYARTQMLGLVHELLISKYGVYDGTIAKGLLKFWYDQPKMFQDLIDYSAYNIISHTNSVRARDPAIDFDNAYKLDQTYRELVQELRLRLADKFVNSPLDELPDIKR